LTPPPGSSALLVAIGVAFATSACGPSLPLPRLGEHDKDEVGVSVPYAPPPPKVEIIPKAPVNQPTAVWVDGQWMWRGRRWEWLDGKWQVPFEGGRYAPPSIVYLPGKQIEWIAGHWHYGDEP
jgi:hypothetical protein